MSQEQSIYSTNLERLGLVLYYRDLCVLCWRVIRVIKQLDIEVEMRNIWRQPE